MQFDIGAIFGAVVGQALNGTIAPMTTAIGLAGILCLLLNRLLVPRSLATMAERLVEQRQCARVARVEASRV